MSVSKKIKNTKSIQEIINSSAGIISFLSRFPFVYKKIKNETTVIIALRKLGDAVFTIPAIKEIQKNCTGRLFLICFPETAPIYSYALKSVEIITLAHIGFLFNDRIANRASRKTLKSLNAGRVIDLTGVITSAGLIFSSRADKITGTNEIYFRSIYSDYISDTGGGHLIEQYLSIAEHVNDKKALFKEFASDFDRKGFILIHPFAGWKAKEWNISKFISLVKEINSEYESYVVLPPENSRKELKDKLISAGLVFKETGNIDELISLINGCSVFISNDSGPLQIAALMGKATFTIYGPTNPAFHLPKGKSHAYIQKNISCSPVAGEKFCFTDAGRDGCPSFECMNLLSVEEVIPKIMDFISSLGIEKKLMNESAGKPGL